jgi:hypothetical protein
MKTKNKKTRREQKEKEIRESIRRVRDGEWADKGRDPIKMVGKNWTAKAVKASDAKGLPVIKILAERNIKMVELDLDIPDKVADNMYKYGRKHILLDRTHVINWVFNLGLRNFVESHKKNKKCTKH